MSIFNQVEFINDKTAYVFFDPRRPEFMETQTKLRDVFLAGGWEYKDAYRGRDNKLMCTDEGNLIYYWELKKCLKEQK